MQALHAALAGTSGTSGASSADHPDDSAYASIASRLALFAAAPPPPPPPTLPAIDIDRAGRHSHQPRENQRRLATTTPPLNRTSMVPQPWGELNPLIRWFRTLTGLPERTGQDARKRAAPIDAPDPRGNWQRGGLWRRLTLLVLMVGQSALGTYFMSAVLPYHGAKPLEMGMLALFAILFCWVSVGFWTAMAGFLVLLRGGDRYLISTHVPDGGVEPAIDPAARTAIVMPICNEDVCRVFAGLRATIESVQRSGELPQFDFFVLSDSNEPDLLVAELAAWNQLCQELDGFGHIFYRHRQLRVKRKSGNIDNFCRRWGSNYRYMIVLDADSVMSGHCLTRLVRLMEANPGSGIIQTAPRASGRDTLYARIQQFSSRVYGPLFTAGMHYWQLGESHYWGHNAIIRMAPFMRHCALAPLPGRGVFAGDILSHDFVEAALMRRAGWAVWIAYDLPGSYEEMPPNLLDELKRDRRWCHGNLMNFRLFMAQGMHPVHRTVFATGVMAYLSAPLWFLFLGLSTSMLATHTLTVPEYFTMPRQLFPTWPEWHPEKAVALFSATATLLFLPKILSVLLVCVQGAKGYGGVLRLTLGMFIEMVFSALLAPVRMLFHSRFVAAAFLGWEMRWKSPPRDNAETGWSEALRKHGSQTLLGLVWGGGVYWLNPSYLLWLLPIVGALVISVPLSVLSSRVAPGRTLRRLRLFLIPEEVQPPPALRATTAHLAASLAPPTFADAVVDPRLNALVCACATARPGLPLTTRAQHAALVDRALLEGPDALTPAQAGLLLQNPLALSRLHLAVWSAPLVHAQWRVLTGKGRGQLMV
ncbi:glucans biosynthesis glucosyltransferase MdoH [Actimicrobium antarcticum]|uniref:Glucans biosynthesis glucosyltransferase H n=2 Tax=Actimicrobium antarcticum TaxID=1051899 RepID=A0ABP7TSC6_9BURK